MAYTRNYQIELEELIADEIGYEELYNAISEYFSSDDMCKALESIATDYEIEYEDEDEDEEE